MQAGLLSFDEFLARRAVDKRLARLTHDVGLPVGEGLEFGPAANPTLLPNGIDVTYVDHAADATATIAGAVAIDHAWTGSGSLATVLARDAFDFAIAAQVAQYVPNLLGWFRGIHEVLRPGGVLNLSLPDKRFMFDAVRPTSTLAELIEADLLSFERPSPRQLFAHAFEARSISPEQIWRGGNPNEAKRMSGDDALAHAYRQTVASLANYELCHCWVFTPASFLDRIEEASRLGLFPLVLNHLSAPDPHEFEFFVSMRRDRLEGEALQQAQAAAVEHLRGTLATRRKSAALLSSE